MKTNTNTWNRIRYTLYTPGYDLAARFMSKSRKKSIDSLNIKQGEKVLIVGAGTGLDLEFLPSNCEITATDITPSMVNRIKKRNSKLKLNVISQVMDGQNLSFNDNEFDVVILHLILAVIPDPIACINEVSRVLKDGGRVAVYDKFIAKNSKISKTRKFLNIVTSFLFSDITRDIYAIIKDTKFEIEFNIAADLNGVFRRIMLVSKNPINQF